MLRILESQAPAKQNATDTIATLSSRLQSATLLEDRRAAILGLRSFAKLYPASVASGALRDLIAGLRRDGEDSDTLKVVLETLLMLFEPDAKSSEASAEITLWLADEFTQRQDNITALLDLLESGEFYLRLYALQILSHILAARPERTQDTIFTAPLGVSRIVAVLDDKREPVRNEALTLLVALTPASLELQKAVAFDNAFDRIFALIEADGSFTHGSSTVQDALSLSANLLKLNVTNQSSFREFGCIPKLLKMLADVVTEENSKEGVSQWVKPQRDVNLWGALALIQLFVVKGGQGTPLNQSAFWHSGALVTALQIAFDNRFSISIRAKALDTCADLIRGNRSIQEQFGDLLVPKPRLDAPLTNGNAGQVSVEQPIGQTNGHTIPSKAANVIEVLLQLTLESSSIAAFDLRLAACNCLKAFFEGHAGIRLHVLRRAIEGFETGEDEVPNMLLVLFNTPEGRGNSDPYQGWMAAVLLLHLINEDSEAKALALSVSEGNSENGEEVITFVQAVIGNVIAGVKSIEDERALLGYLMLLSVWLFEEPDAVNDLLSEGSSVQSLIQAVKISSARMPLVAGLCTLLLGVVYEFSTKDSPIPRNTLHGLLINSLGRELYVDRLTKLRENVFVRNFEVLPQSSQSALDGSLPDVYFDSTFIDFFKDHYSRILRAIDRDPNLEVSILSNGVQKGISRELVDSLRAQLDDRTKALQNVEADLLKLKSKLEQEELDHRRTRDSSIVEVGRIRQINQSLQDGHEEELRHIQSEHAKSHSDLIKQHQTALGYADQRFRDSSIEADDKAARARERNEAEIADMKTTIAELQARLAKTQKDHVQDLQTAHDEYAGKKTLLESRLKRAEERSEEADARARDLTKRAQEADRIANDLKASLDDKEASRRAAQTELDDLLVVFADLEAKRAIDKDRLKALGEEVSEDEDELAEAAGEEDGDADSGDDDENAGSDVA